MDGTSPDAPVDASTADAQPDEDLSTLSDEELSSKESDLVTQFDSADEADDLEQMSSIADQIDAVRAEKDRRGSSDDTAAPTDDTTVPDQVTASAAAPETTEEPVAETEPEPEVGEGEPEGESEPEPEASAEDADSPEQPAGDEEPAGDSEQPAGDGEQEPEPDTEPEPAETPDGGAEPSDTNDSPNEQQEEPVDIPEDRQPVTTNPVSTIVAGADIPGVGAGMPFSNRSDLNRAFESRLNSIKRATGGDGEQHIVATIQTSAPESRTLDQNDVAGNIAKIDDVVRREALVASGGYCAPLETRYDIFGTGTTDRPVRDALAGFQATRGGIRYTASPKITDYSSAIALWTAANDANPTAPTTKPCLAVACTPEQTALLDAVTLCLQFGNLQTRAYPEMIDRHNQLALVAHARFAERTLLAKIAALSTAVTSATVLGTARDFLNAVGKAAAAYRNRYRMEDNEPLRVIAPAWVKDAMREDLARQMPGDDTLSLADSVINGYFSTRNVNVSWHLDGTGFSDEVGASALDDFPATFDWNIYAEGAFLFLDGGTLDLGVVRDSTLVGTNDYKTFTESFEGVAKIGAEALKVTTTTKVAGASAGTVATLP